MLFAQITDLHIAAEAKDAVDFSNPQRLRQAISYLNRIPFRPHFVLVTGDVADKQTFGEDYARARRHLDELKMPYYLMVGNHDDRDAMRAAFPEHAYLKTDNGFINYVIEQPSVDVIALDTLIPGRHPGELCDVRLEWLRATLAGRREKPVLIAMHHPPFLTMIESMDRLRCIKGVPELAEIFRQNPNIQGLICGHVHRNIDTMWEGRPALVGGSIAPAVELRLDGNENVSIWPEPPSVNLISFKPETGLLAHQLPYVPGARLWDGRVR